jgi:hypothetical protein
MLRTFSVLLSSVGIGFSQNGSIPQRIATESRMLGEFHDDKDAVAKAQRLLRDWNAQNANMQITIHARDVMQRAKAMRETRTQRFVKSAPKGMRERARELLAETERDHE